MPATTSEESVDVLLADGSTAAIRPVCADDSDGVAALYSGLSQHSSVLRFFGPHRLSPAELERMTHLGGPDAGALVVERDGVVVAMAEYCREPGTEEADVAFVVDDAHQGRGIGTLLLEHLADRARARGIRRFVADTLSYNDRMLAVLRDAGFARQYERMSEVVRVVLDISPTPEAVASADERDRSAVVRSMQRLLQPGSIAVVGASRQRGTIGHELLRNLVSGGFCGPVYPVNPAADSIGGVPCWPDLDSVPGPVDLAVLAVPAAQLADVVDACGRKGVGGLVVISAGFAETGAAGAEAQVDVVRRAHGHGMRVVGPNCFGVVNADPSVSMNATFAADAPLFGRVGFASQSGGLGIAILAEARARGLGLSSFASLGNKADVSGNDLLTWWEQDEGTDVALLYLESLGNPRKFSRIARRVSRAMPIVAVKSGRSGAGQRAASSHTAALASSDRAVDALFRQTGVVRVDTVEELFDTAEVLAHQPLPGGSRVGVIGNAGGPGVLAADACSGHGLELPELTADTQRALARLLPPGASVRNPVDMVASATAQMYGQVLSVLLAGDEVDALVVVFTPPMVTAAADVADAVVAAVDESTSSKPVVAAFLGAEHVRARLRAAQHPVPCFTYPESAVRALAHARGYSRWRSRPEGAAVSLTATDANEARRRLATRSSSAPWVTGAEAAAVLDAYGIEMIPTRTARDAPSAALEASALGFPVALKASGPELVHKSDVGGVRLGLATEAAVRAAYDDMARRLGPSMDGAVLQAMVGPAVETIAGFVRDPAFGPLVVFGAGGTAVELLDDTITRLVPLTDVDAREMVLGLRTSALLTGYRGSPPADVDALVELVLRLGQLADDLPEIAEVDCNPVMASASGAVVVDARLRLHDAPVPGEGLRRLR